MSSDQAAGLRNWAEKNRPAAQPPVTATPEQTLVVVGLPQKADGNPERVRKQLTLMAERGKQWVGDASTWRLLVADGEQIDYAALAAEYPRWALWIEPDSNGYQRAYYALRQLAVQGGPKRLLLLHPPVVSTRGLINNVRDTALKFFNIELISVRLPAARKE